MSPRFVAFLTIATALLAGCASQPAKLPDGTQAKVAILETTDIHSNVLSYDYYKLKPDSTLGFERTATLLGHAHTEFPGPHYASMKDVDAERGLVRGVPAVMGGFFGKDLGVIQLTLDRRHGCWVVDRSLSRSEVRPICTTVTGANKTAAKSPPQNPTAYQPIHRSRRCSTPRRPRRSRTSTRRSAKAACA